MWTGVGTDPSRGFASPRVSPILPSFSKQSRFRAFPTRKSGNSAFLVIVISLTLALTALAQDNNAKPSSNTAKGPGSNIALGRPYRYSSSPRYKHSNDSGDKVQLTDGIYSEGTLWMQKSALGWQNEAYITVTIDLGEDKPIRGVSFNTAAGASAVTWPTALYVLVAGVDKVFYEAGNLVELSSEKGQPKPEGYAAHRYWTDRLKTHGRYVMFVFDALPFRFSDEVEVYAGEPEWVNLPLTGRTLDEVKELMKARAVQHAVKRRIMLDLKSVQEKAAAATVPPAVRKQVLGDLAAVAKDMDQFPKTVAPGFRAILPVHPLHARVLAARAALWRVDAPAPVFVWQSDLWECGDYRAMPVLEGEPAVAVHTMQGEYRAASLNITNTTDQAETARVQVRGLPGGLNPRYVTVHEVPWTDTKSMHPVLAALPVLKAEGEAYALTVVPGLTGQVWFTFHPTDVQPGTYTGEVVLTSASLQAAVPVTLRVYPFRFPEEPTLHFGGWDYTNGAGHRGVTPNNMGPLLDHLREHFVDSPWATRDVIPKGIHRDDGSMATPPDTAPFDEWVDRWQDARRYQIFAAVGDTFDRWNRGTPEFHTAVKAWAAFWGAHARKRGIDRSRMAWLLVDEPHGGEADERIVSWARAIREANAGIRIWEDPCHLNMAEANQEMIGLSDVLCANRPRFLQQGPTYWDYFEEQRTKGKTLELYSCAGPVRVLDPYRYYRLQAWDCWKFKATASYFWAFGASGEGSSWNEYAVGGRDFCPHFLDTNSVTPGKHMEAAREGIEDYEYLVMLRNAVARAEQRGKEGDALNKARSLLNGAVTRVCPDDVPAAFPWSRELDRSTADAVRIEILEALLALRN